MLLTIDTHRKIDQVLNAIGCRLRVHYRGEDLTDWCFVADDYGWMGIYEKRDGGAVADPSGKSLAKALVVGPVEFYIVHCGTGRQVKAVMCSDEPDDEE